MPYTAVLVEQNDGIYHLSLVEGAEPDAEGTILMTSQLQSAWVPAGETFESQLTDGILLDAEALDALRKVFRPIGVIETEDDAVLDLGRVLSEALAVAEARVELLERWLASEQARIDKLMASQ